MRELTIYSLLDVSKPPIPLVATIDNYQYTFDYEGHHPKSALIFSLEDLEDIELNVILHMFDSNESVKLGVLSEKSKCVFWEDPASARKRLGKKGNGRIIVSVVGHDIDIDGLKPEVIEKETSKSSLESVHKDAKLKKNKSESNISCNISDNNEKTLKPKVESRDEVDGTIEEMVPTPAKVFKMPEIEFPVKMESKSDSFKQPVFESILSESKSQENVSKGKSRKSSLTDSVKASTSPKMTGIKDKKQATLTDILQPVSKSPTLLENSTKDDKKNKECPNTAESPLHKKRKLTRSRNSKEKLVLAHDKENISAQADVPMVPVIPIKKEPSGPPNEVIDAESRSVTYKRGSQPVNRWGHSFTIFDEEQAVLIGGQGGEKQQFCKDSIWVFNIEDKRWFEPDSKFENIQNPEMRVGHSATFDPTVRCIYIYGGSKNKRWFNDVHVLDLDEWTWQLVKTNGKAPTRAYHTSVLFRHELWIFGGVFPRPDPQPDGSSNDINIYSPLTESWYTPLMTGEARPEPRSGHSATVIGESMIIFGGWDFPVCYNEIYVLDMSIVEWTKPAVNGTPPSPRSWHGACQLSGNRILIHGGYDAQVALHDSAIFNLDTMTWYTVNPEPEIIARVGHKCICRPYKHENSEKDEVIIFGGGDNDGQFFGNLTTLQVPCAKPIEIME